MYAQEKAVCVRCEHTPMHVCLCTQTKNHAQVQRNNKALETATRPTLVGLFKSRGPMHTDYGIDGALWRCAQLSRPYSTKETANVRQQNLSCG